MLDWLESGKNSGLILAARVGKRTDELIEELVISTEGKTDCQQWDTDGWGGYERVLLLDVQHRIGKARTQGLERTNGILRQQTGLSETNLGGVGADRSDDTIDNELL